MKNIPISEKLKKISIFSRIKLKKTQIVNKIKGKYEKSLETQSFISMIFEIITYSLLGGCTYLVLVTSNILLIFLGIGCGLWLLINKIIPEIIKLLSSIKFISLNR